MRERGAQRDSLLLAARELARVGVDPVCEADLAEELGRPSAAFTGRLAGKREPERHELAGRQLGRERLRVPLIRIAQLSAAVAVKPAPAQATQVDSGNANPSRRGSIEPRQDPEQRRLARAARPEHGHDLALLHSEAEPLKRGGRAFLRRVDAEDVLNLDRGPHATSAVAVALCSRNDARVSSATRRSATPAKTTTPRVTTGQSGASTSGGTGVVEFALTASASRTTSASTVPSSTPPTSPASRTAPARSRTWWRSAAGPCPGLEVEELAGLVAELDGDSQRDADERE